MTAPFICENCGSTHDIIRTMAFDLCHGCLAALHFEHQCYAEAQSRNMSRDAGCPVPERVDDVQP